MFSNKKKFVSEKPNIEMKNVNQTTAFVLAAEYLNL
jgi:hypothetical protein